MRILERAALSARSPSVASPKWRRYSRSKKCVRPQRGNSKVTNGTRVQIHDAIAESRMLFWVNFSSSAAAAMKPSTSADAAFQRVARWRARMLPPDTETTPATCFNSPANARYR